MTLYQSHTNPHGNTVDVTWAQLEGFLSEVVDTDCHPCPGSSCLAKRGMMWSPTRMTGSRQELNVESVSVAVIDLDHLPESAMEACVSRVLPYQVIVHASHSDTPGDRCIRLVLPLSRPVPRVDWHRFWYALVSALDLGAHVDRACKDASRAYFLPSRPVNAPFLFESQDGPPIDVDSVLALAPPAPATSKALSAAGIVPPPEAQDLEKLREMIGERARKKAYGTAHEEKEQHLILRRVLDGESLAPKGKRDSTLLRAMGMIASIVPPTTGYDAAFEIVRQSVMLMLDKSDPEDTVDVWREEGRDMYDRAMVTRVQRDAQRAEERERVAAMVASIMTTKGEGTPSQAAPVAAGEEREGAPANWFKDLPRKQDGTLKNNPQSVILILSYDDKLRGWLRWNEIRARVEILGGQFANTPEAVLGTHVRAWLSAKYGLACSLSDVEAALLFVARMAPYNPVAEYLRAIAWDGVERIDTWLATHGKAEVEHNGEDISEHVSRVGARWLVSAVARAIEPGCQVDTVLVLEGPQGYRKTTALRVLGGEYHSSMTSDLREKDARIGAAAAWIVELAELDALKRSQVSAMKAFIGETVDRYRPPYGRTQENFPRRCVFVGTTNEENYLADTTGNRRFWPVKVCGEIDRVALARDRDQLWAEAVARYQQHVDWRAKNPGLDANLSPFRWWFVGDESEQAERIANSRGEDLSGMFAAVLLWWALKAPSSRPTFVVLRELAVEAGLATQENVPRRLEMELGVLLRKYGWVKERRLMVGQHLRGYVPPTAWRTLPQTSGGARALSDLLSRLDLDSGALSAQTRN